MNRSLQVQGTCFPVHFANPAANLIWRAIDAFKDDGPKVFVRTLETKPHVNFLFQARKGSALYLK